MDICRVCLCSESNMFQLDELFIVSYNILTSLNVKIYDELPQYSCQKCLNRVKKFIEFREKCISSEIYLQKLFTNWKSESDTLKLENNSIEIDDENSVTLKKEIKLEIYEEQSLDHFDGGISDKEDFIESQKIEDIKATKRSRKLKVKDKKNLKTKKKSLTLVVEKEIDEPNNIEPILCGLCKATFNSNVDLNEHLEKHIKDRFCTLCEEVSDNWAQLLGHRLSHVPVKQKRCHICNKRFLTNISLEYHYKKVHFGEDATLTCKFCASKYHTPKQLHKHIWGSHSNKNYTCDYCSKSFTARSNLKSHIISHMQKKSYICHLCGLSFNYSGGLKDHTIRRHMPLKVYCKKCKRPFPSREAHDKHTCNNTKKILCSTCGKRFSTSQIKRHLLTHTNISKYACNRCPASYKSRSGLQAHLDRHDGNKTQQCEYCPAKFYTGSTLIKHRRIHTGEKPYVCKVCHKGFTGNHNLKVHMKVHGEYLVNRIEKPSEERGHDGKKMFCIEKNNSQYK